MLVVPLGLIGAVIAVFVTGMTNDVFFKVGLITLIGLSAKNAILIVEFASSCIAKGNPYWRRPFMPPVSVCAPF